MLRPEAFTCGGQQPVRTPFKGERLAIQPTAERLGVVQRGFTKAERRTDLGTVVFDGPATPIVALPRDCCHADLARDGFDRGGRHVLRAAWKPALGLEQLEQHGKAQARGAGLVAEQRAVGGAQRPAVMGVAAGPVSHHASPCRSAPVAAPHGHERIAPNAAAAIIPATLGPCMAPACVAMARSVVSLENGMPAHPMPTASAMAPQPCGPTRCVTSGDSRDILPLRTAREERGRKAERAERGLVGVVRDRVQPALAGRQRRPGDPAACEAHEQRGRHVDRKVQAEVDACPGDQQPAQADQGNRVNG